MDDCPWFCHHKACIEKRSTLLEELKNGETAQSAKLDYKPNVKSSLKCFRCNGFGHVFDKCPNDKPVCGDCHALGFFTRNCPCKSKNDNKGAKDSQVTVISQNE